MIYWQEFLDHDDWIVINRHVYKIKEVNNMDQIQDGLIYVDIGYSDKYFIILQKLKPISSEDIFEYCQYFTMDEIKNHTVQSDIWCLIEGLVYDVTNYFDFHPVGGQVFLNVAGRDATIEFQDAIHSVGAIKHMRQFLIGKFCQLKQKKSRQPLYHLINFKSIVSILFMIMIFRK